MKWLYVYLPHLYAESCVPTFHTDTPVAIVNPQQMIIDRNPCAEHFGISNDMNLNSAFCLCPQLQVYHFDNNQLQMAQNRLAKIAGRFSSWVSLETDQGIYLEIASMRRLFRSTKNLHQQLQQFFHKHGYTVKAAAAPFAATARLLAHAGFCHGIYSQQIEATLAPLPIQDLGIKPATELKLLRMGINSLADLHALDRNDLAQRIDKDTLTILARVYGEQPWLPQPFTPAAVFFDHIELEQDFESLLPLRFIIAQRLTQFCDFLLKRQLLCQELQLNFYDREGQCYTERLFLACPERRVTAWHYMLNTHLERWKTNTPIVRITLSASQFIDQTAPALDLFAQPAQEQRQHQTILLNRISSKLGFTALRFIQLSNDPRPEKANQCSSERLENHPHKPAQRFRSQPIWLHNTMQPFNKKIKTIWHGPTRMETGWWDTSLQQRDYYITSDQDHIMRWVFRTPDGQSFEHGLFG